MQRQDFDYRKLLDKLVNDRLLIQEAVALGIHEEPRLTEMLDKRRDKQAVSRWVKDHYQLLHRNCGLLYHKIWLRNI